MRCLQIITFFVFHLISLKDFAQKTFQNDQLKYFDHQCIRYSQENKNDSLILFAAKGLAIGEVLQNYSYINLFASYAASAFIQLSKTDTVIYFLKISETAAYKINSCEKITDAQIKLANAYYDIGSSAMVLLYQKKMIAELDTMKDEIQKIKLYKTVAAVYVNNNEYEKAITAYMQILEYGKKNNDKKTVAVAFVNLGNLYLQMNNNEKSLSYLLTAMPLLSGYDYGQIICADNIGAAYSNLKMFDSAIVYHKIAITLSKKIKDTDDIYAAYEKLGFALIGNKEYLTAEAYLTPALKYALATKNATEIIDGEYILGESEFEQKSYNTAISYFSKALDYAQKTNHKERMNELYKFLAQTADSAHQYSLAVKYYSQYILLNDSLKQESSKKTIADLETKYQTQQKQQQIFLLQQKSNIQVLALKDQKKQTLLWISCILFFSGIIFMYVVYRSRIKQLKKLTEVRNDISRDLHDEIGATLSSINIYSEVAKNKLSGNNDVKQLLHRIHDGSAQMMEGMSDIVWYINPKNDSAENTIIKMREYAAPVLEATDTNLNFIVEDEVKKLKLNMHQRQHFYLIFKEAINNIAKYAQAKNTSVSINFSNKQIALQIKDDGKGFNLNNHKQGNGLLNIRQRIKLLKGHCDIISTAGNGTVLIINFPVSL